MWGHSMRILVFASRVRARARAARSHRLAPGLCSTTGRGLGSCHGPPWPSLSPDRPATVEPSSLESRTVKDFTARPQLTGTSVQPRVKQAMKLLRDKLPMAYPAPRGTLITNKSQLVDFLRAISPSDQTMYLDARLRSFKKDQLQPDQAPFLLAILVTPINLLRVIDVAQLGGSECFYVEPPQGEFGPGDWGVRRTLRHLLESTNMRKVGYDVAAVSTQLYFRYGILMRGTDDLYTRGHTDLLAPQGHWKYRRPRRSEITGRAYLLSGIRNRVAVHREYRFESAAPFEDCLNTVLSMPILEHIVEEERAAKSAGEGDEALAYKNRDTMQETAAGEDKQAGEAKEAEAVKGDEKDEHSQGPTRWTGEAHSKLESLVDRLHPHPSP